jgi:acetone carboxylase gamma subunit
MGVKIIKEVIMGGIKILQLTKLKPLFKDEESFDKFVHELIKKARENDQVIITKDDTAIAVLESAMGRKRVE